MTASERPRERSMEPEEPPADEEYARTYAAGYEEGVRNALKEILAHASRGRTNQELRALIQSRLARLGEEVDLKRRSLLAPPRPRPFGELQRPAGVLGARASVLDRRGAPASVGPGQTVLVREARPEHAVELLLASRTRFPRVVLVSHRPPDLGPGPGETIVVPLGEAHGPSDEHLSASEVGGRLRGPISSPGGALVYVDALEYLVTVEGPEIALRFARWLVEEVAKHGSAVLLSYDPRALAVTDSSRLERLFGEVVDRTSSPRASSP